MIIDDTKYYKIIFPYGDKPYFILNKKMLRTKVKTINENEFVYVVSTIQCNVQLVFNRNKLNCE